MTAFVENALNPAFPTVHCTDNWRSDQVADEVYVIGQ
ncbi:hypothetical protein AN901_202866 [Pseudomonas syringae pv. theae]|uniref:Uncharacterized protein n=1 Tax=Pseudomonas syringae pv. theae TaxID=103985 RepID=A0A0Q0GDG1_PSESX|nr:Unknown protein sequence [Pseudomonas cannabina pv. alisalensis]KPZ34685.1 hypothetical protein AN901_202866 [Pseudomonas syringae pv. theae]RMT76056.1 hypothetical protein ALP44_00009 [Pseudomonas syringae pv. theae]